MKVGIVLDNKVNKWALQRFEPLKDKLDVTVFVGERNDYDVSSIDLHKRFLTHREEIFLALSDPLTAYRRVLTAPYKKMDFYYFSLRKYLQGFDLAYSCDVTRSAYTLASLKNRLGFKFVLSWWENIPFRAVFDKKTNFQKKLVMEKVDKFLPFTELSAKVLKAEDIQESKIEVLYPGVDLKRFKPGDKPEKLLARNKIPKNFFVILYIGKIVSWKGVHNLVYVAKILKERGIKDFVVAVAGKGAQRNNMERLIGETDTYEHFRFLDFVSYDEIPDIYRMADLLVLPSYPTMTWQEQFGMVLVEAMASGTLVISTNSGSIPEVVGEGGVLIHPGDFFSLGDTIHRFIKDSSLGETIAKRGRVRAERLFDIDKNSSAIQCVFKKVTDGQ